MIALADTMRTTSLRLVGAWNAFATRYNPFALIAVACAVLTGPLIFFRGYNSDEGLAVSIARTALEDGEWLVPHVFNMRWVERPTLLLSPRSAQRSAISARSRRGCRSRCSSCSAAC